MAPDVLKLFLSYTAHLKIMKKSDPPLNSALHTCPSSPSILIQNMDTVSHLQLQTPCISS